MNLFTIQGFLNPDECTRLIKEAESSEKIPEPVYDEGGKPALVPEIRITSKAEISDASRRGLKSKITSLIPQLEEFFDLELRECQELQLLVWEVGSHFAVHQDAAEVIDAAEFLVSRKISIVVFLNEPISGTGSGAFSGGELVFSTSDPERGEVLHYFDIRTGSLIGFRSQQLHGVLPVASGTRYSVVAWFV